MLISTLRKPRVIVDRHKRIFAVLAGRPNDPSWEAVHKAVAQLLEAERPKLKKSYCPTRNTVPLSSGISYGGGQTVCSAHPPVEDSLTLH
jgi:hypothetical protein